MIEFLRSIKLVIYRQKQGKTLGLNEKKLEKNNLIGLEQDTGEWKSLIGEVVYAVTDGTRCQSYPCFFKINREQINWSPKIINVKIRKGN